MTGPAPDPQERLKKVYAFIQEHQHGGCHIISKGDACDCALCSMDQVVDSFRADLAAVRAQLEQSLRSEELLQAQLCPEDVSVEEWVRTLEKRAHKAEAELTALRADYEYCKKERAAARADANLQRQLHQELQGAHKGVKSQLTELRARLALPPQAQEPEQ